MSRPAHVFETYIRATPQAVWAALTKPEFTRQYFFHTAVNSGWEPNGSVAYTMPNGSLAVDGVLVEVDEPRRLVMTWSAKYAPALAGEPPSRVEWTITPLCDDPVVCRVVLRHGDLFNSPNTWAHTADGWNVVINGLKSVLETGTPLGQVPADGGSPFSATQPADIAFHKTMASQANGRTYELLDSRENDELMIHAAHASAYHWSIAGTPLNRARAEYLCSRVHAFAGHGAEALRHARRCAVLLSDAEGAQDFDRAYAHEAMARSLACSGDSSAATAELLAALGVVVDDPEDRAIVEADLAAEPWYGVTPRGTE